MHPRLFCCAGNWPDPCSSAALGYKGFTADELVQLKIHGVIPDYARSLQVHGMKNLNADQLVRLKISGFQPSFQSMEIGRAVSKKK